MTNIHELVGQADTAKTHIGEGLRLANGAEQRRQRIAALLGTIGAALRSLQDDVLANELPYELSLLRASGRAAADQLRHADGIMAAMGTTHPLVTAAREAALTGRLAFAESDDSVRGSADLLASDLHAIRNGVSRLLAHVDLMGSWTDETGRVLTTGITAGTQMSGLLDTYQANIQGGPPPEDAY